MDISKSLFSLVKYNNGEFKSEKQKAFLTSFFVDGAYSHTTQYHFGEYEQKTKRNTATITFQFLLNITGDKITKVTKNNSTYWELTANSQSQCEENKRKQEEKKAAFEEVKQKHEYSVKLFNLHHAMNTKLIKYCTSLDVSDERVLWALKRMRDRVKRIESKYKSIEY